MNCYATLLKFQQKENRMNIVTERYRGYYIEPIGNGQYDITELNGDLVDGGFASIEECKHIIDHFDHEGT